MKLEHLRYVAWALIGATLLVVAVLVLIALMVIFLKTGPTAEPG